MRRRQDLEAWRGLVHLTLGLAAAWLLAAGCGSEEKVGDDLVPPPPGILLINELMARNTSTISDETGAFADWIELWNPGPDDARTGGLYLSDDFGTPDWALPDTTIATLGYVLIWADDDTLQRRWHARFRLKGDGDEAVLVRSSASGFALVDSVSFGAQRADTSYARQPDGGAWSVDPTPTPRAPND